MPCQVIRRTFEIFIDDLQSGRYALRGQNDALSEERHPLRVHVELIGETQPYLSPLSVDIGDDEAYRVYRYDWIMGIGLIAPCWWDWLGAIRAGNSLAFHILFDPGEASIGFSFVSTNLQVLTPSRNTASWLERWGPLLGNILTTTSTTTGAAMTAVSPALATVIGNTSKIMKYLPMLANTLETKTGDRTNWFVYQIMDGTKNVCAIEWTIDKEVIRQYGPVLRGSVVLAFHGDVAKDAPPSGARLIGRPQLGFKRNDDLKYVVPTEHLSPDEQVYLPIAPIPVIA